MLISGVSKPQYEKVSLQFTVEDDNAVTAQS